jgi:hypothetical protein
VISLKQLAFGTCSVLTPATGEAYGLIWTPKDYSRSAALLLKSTLKPAGATHPSCFWYKVCSPIPAGALKAFNSQWLELIYVLCMLAAAFNLLQAYTTASYAVYSVKHMHILAYWQAVRVDVYMAFSHQLEKFVSQERLAASVGQHAVPCLLVGHHGKSRISQQPAGLRLVPAGSLAPAAASASSAPHQQRFCCDRHAFYCTAVKGQSLTKAAQVPGIEPHALFRNRTRDPSRSTEISSH